MASSAPQLNAQLTQRNIPYDKFRDDFNERTADIKSGIPLPCRVKVHSDRTYDLEICKPPATYFLKQAAGIQRGKIKKDDVAGKITLKHLYEIAKIKSEDRSLALLDLQQVTQMLVGIAKTCGIEIVREIDPEEYAQFIKDRKVRLDEYDEELKEIREKKALKGNVV
ncbi:hypothetical protein HN011_009533 [Eciton burchellii]|nr:hypothetical protein HN011_009533 [Eciton burchellii]